MIISSFIAGIAFVLCGTLNVAGPVGKRSYWNNSTGWQKDKYWRIEINAKARKAFRFLQILVGAGSIAMGLYMIAEGLLPLIE